MRITSAGPILNKCKEELKNEFEGTDKNIQGEKNSKTKKNKAQKKKKKKNGHVNDKPDEIEGTSTKGGIQAIQWKYKQMSNILK